MAGQGRACGAQQPAADGCPTSQQAPSHSSPRGLRQAVGCTLIPAPPTPTERPRDAPAEA